MAQLIQPRENVQGGHLHRTFKNCLNDEGKDLAGYKVVVEDFLWLPVGLNMDCHTRDTHCYMRVVRLTGDLPIDCTQKELGFQERGLVSWRSDLRKREDRAEQPPPILTLPGNSILILCVPLRPEDRV